ncbi:MAG: hypothetical protein HW391_533 [Chloroflexi bacterium]|nr:hypothetical protein [Chloroflexota bacterium]
MDRIRRINPRLALLSAAVLTLAACGGAAQATPDPTPAPTEPAATEPAMQIMAKGDFQDIDGSATGIAELVVLPDGTYEVILDNFAIDSIEHTNVVLVANADVMKTADVDPTMFLDLGALKSKDGMQVYAIPADMAATVMDGYHAVVIWDTAMAHALAAAPLK